MSTSVAVCPKCGERVHAYACPGCGELTVWGAILGEVDRLRRERLRLFDYVVGVEELDHMGDRPGAWGLNLSIARAVALLDADDPPLHAGVEDALAEHDRRAASKREG